MNSIDSLFAVYVITGAFAAYLGAAITLFFLILAGYVGTDVVRWLKNRKRKGQ